MGQGNGMGPAGAGAGTAPRCPKRRHEYDVAQGAFLNSVLDDGAVDSGKAYINNRQRKLQNAFMCQKLACRK